VSGSPSALILVDGRPVRDKAQREYEKVVRDLEKARHELEQFEQRDVPSYQRWLNKNFGALLTELREAHKKLADKRELLNEIEWLSMQEGISSREAYERVIWSREHPEPNPPKEDDRSEQEDFGASGRPQWEDEDDFMRELEEEFRRLFGSRPSNARRHAESRQPDILRDRLKDIYRRLVRLLHPDLQKTMTPQKTELWHQAQAAYQKGDIDQLEVIMTLCEIKEHGTTANTSISLLMRICRQFRSSLRALRKQLKKCRQDPAWDFCHSKDLASLTRRLEQNITRELAEVLLMLKAVEWQLGVWASKPVSRARRASQRRRSSASAHPEFFF
jgi:hypothetical protein